jgi:drug/metabolite transporter (DMT)-like permease
VVVLIAEDEALPKTTLAFVAWVAGGAVSQIAATALLLRVMVERNFTLGVAYSKTELVQVAVFGLVFLGDPLSAVAAVAVLLGTTGVLFLSPPDRQRPIKSLVAGWTSQTAMLGLASGGGFALAAVGYRGAALELRPSPFLVSAAWTLVWAQALQTLVLGGSIVASNPAVIRRMLVAWRPSAGAGFMGVAASVGWFSAMAIEPVAHVRTLGLVELVFSYLLSRRIFRERLHQGELFGIVLLCFGLVAIMLG